MQQWRVPTAPFPPRTSNTRIPFMSFEIGSAPTASYGSGAIGGGPVPSAANFDEEPPLLDEPGRGYQVRHIWSFRDLGPHGLHQSHGGSGQRRRITSLVDCGLKEENIVVFMFDDITNSELNPRPGTIINHPQGDDLYAGVPKFASDDANPDGRQLHFRRLQFWVRRLQFQSIGYKSRGDSNCDPFQICLFFLFPP
ncbi:unnamed protein product [Linum trigynum]|uniref:Uncharacterized protein n=1 Tax=Linum trigynum TaxID=586398 RepID=A0AAV2G8K8_9ROSI